MLQNEGENHSLLWIGGHRIGCVEHFPKKEPPLLPPTHPKGPNAGSESVAVRGALICGRGGSDRRPVAAEVKKEIRTWKEGSPEHFLRTQKGPIRP